MKNISLIIASVTLLSFGACKKTVVDPTNATSNSTTVVNTTENTNLANDDKAADPRNKFLGSYTGISSPYTTTYGQSEGGITFKFSITKYSTKKLKVVMRNMTGGGYETFIASLVSNNSLILSSSSVTNTPRGPITVKLTGKKLSTNSKKMNFIYENKSDVTIRYVVLNAVKN